MGNCLSALRSRFRRYTTTHYTTLIDDFVSDPSDDDEIHFFLEPIPSTPITLTTPPITTIRTEPIPIIRYRLSPSPIVDEELLDRILPLDRFSWDTTGIVDRALG